MGPYDMVLLVSIDAILGPLQNTHPLNQLHHITLTGAILSPLNHTMNCQGEWALRF